MNKQELIDLIALNAQVNRVVAERVLDSLVGVIICQLKSGQDIKLGALGRFTAHKRGARTAQNPRTGVPIEVPAKTVARFKPGKALAEAIQ